MQRLIPKLLAIGLLAAASARAGHAFYDFNTDQPDPRTNLFFGGTLWDGTTLSHTGSANWQTNGGAGPAGTTTNGPVQPGIPGDGFLQVTFATGTCNPTNTSAPLTSYLSGCILFNDFDQGLVVAGFTMEADLRIGNGNPNPADGFSISYCRAEDPILTALAAGDTFPQMNNSGVSPNGGQFSDNGNGGDASLMEEGTTTGLAIGFDMWDSGDLTIPPTAPAVGTALPGLTHDGIGLDIRVDGVLQTTISMPNGTTQTTRDEHGNGPLPVTDPNGNNGATDPTSIETGPYDGTGCDSHLAWVHLKVSLDTNGVVNVFWKNKQILTNFQTTFFPSPGRLLVASRVGGNTANIEIDNLEITTFPATQALVGGATGFVDGFQMHISDSGLSVIDITKPIVLTENGTTVSPTSVTKAGAVTTVIYHGAILPSGSTNTATLVAKDTGGNSISSGNRTFIVPTYGSIPTTAAVAASTVDLTQPGFRVRTYQTDLGTPLATQGNSIERTMEDSVRRNEEQLAGLLGANSSSNGNSYYAETNVINYTIRPTGAVQGHFNSNTDTNDPGHYAMTNFPGIATITALTDPNLHLTENLSAEVEGVLEFPDSGVYSITVTSDDGFHLWLGNPATDVFGSQHISEFNGARGWSDTTVLLYITNGFYPYRLAYENGGGDASLEFIAAEISPNPTTNAFVTVGTLVNDSTVPNSIKSYRVTSATNHAAITFITPVPGNGTYAPNAEIAANITDGSDGAIQAGSIKLWLNGAPISPTINKSGNVTSLSFTPSTPNLPGSNNVSIAFTDASGNTQSNSIPFNVLNYIVIPPSMALPASVVNPVSGNGGFIIFGNQAIPYGPGDKNTGNGNYPNSVYRSELQLHNNAQGNNYLGWTNTIDTTDFTGPGGSYVESFTALLGGVINFNGQSGNIGNFNDVNAPDMPGLPSPYTNIVSTDTPAVPINSNFALDIQTVISLQPGTYRIGVNSDDGFNLTFGNPAEWATLPLIVVQFDGGRGASDSTGYFYITQAGLYPARVTYYNGGGGLNVELYTQSVWPDTGWHVPLNDVQASYNTPQGTAVFPAILSYQYPYGATKGSPYISSIHPSASRPGSAESIQASTHTGTDAPISVTLEDGETAITTASVKLWVNGTLVSPTVSKSGTTTTVSYPAPSGGWAPNSTNSIQLAFLDRTVNWSFEVENHKNATFFIEAEDYNYGGGQTLAAASTMPYYGGAYAGVTAVHGTDYYRSSGQDSGQWYRPAVLAGDTVDVPFQINHDLDRGVNELVANERIGWIGGVQWYNYTRTFPSNSYNVYAGLSQGNGVGTTPHARYGVLQMVDSPTAPTVTNSIGLFDDVATGSYGQNGGVGKGAGLVPMTDGAGNLAAITLSGTHTLRMYFPPGYATNNPPITIGGNTFIPQGGSGDFDFLMFVPQGPVVSHPTISLSVSGGQATITYTGSALLYSPNAAGPYQPVTGAVSPYHIPATGAAGFYRSQQ